MLFYHSIKCYFIHKNKHQLSKNDKPNRECSKSFMTLSKLERRFLKSVSKYHKMRKMIQQN